MRVFAYQVVAKLQRTDGSDGNEKGEICRDLLGPGTTPDALWRLHCCCGWSPRRFSPRVSSGVEDVSSAAEG
jgi:hypothetical protein